MGYSSCLHKPCILSLACLGFSPIDCDQCEIIEEIYQESIGAEDRDSLHSFSRCSALQSTLAALRISILRQRSSSNIHAGSSNGLALTLFSLRHRRIPSPCFSRSSWIQTARPYQGCHRYRTSWDSILWVFDCELVQQSTPAFQPWTRNAGREFWEGRTSDQTALHSSGLPHCLDFNPGRSPSRIQIGEDRSMR